MEDNSELINLVPLLKTAVRCEVVIIGGYESEDICEFGEQVSGRNEEGNNKSGGTILCVIL